MSGTVGGKELGIAIFDDPGNPRHPTYWHVRGYGLLAANIFGVKAFAKDPAADGSLTLNQGAKLHFQYRVVIHTGNARAADLPKLYSRYVHARPSTGLR